MSGSLLIADLLKRYMKERGYTEHWLTVQELRTWFSQDCPSGQALSGFLGRNHNGAFAACRYKVTRIEKSGIQSLPTVSSGGILCRNVRYDKTTHGRDT